jgi:hypothetical protein
MTKLDGNEKDRAKAPLNKTVSGQDAVDAASATA